jgi:hypothetical protein
MKSVDALLGVKELIAAAKHWRKTAADHRARAKPGREQPPAAGCAAIDAELDQLGLPVAATISPARDVFEHAAILHAPRVGTTRKTPSDSPPPTDAYRAHSNSPPRPTHSDILRRDARPERST